MSVRVGIDFGTSNSGVAVYKDGGVARKPEPFPETPAIGENSWFNDNKTAYECILECKWHV